MYVLAITEMIMDLHQRIDSIKITLSSVVLFDPAKLLYAFQQVTKEIVVSKFLFIYSIFGYNNRSTDNQIGIADLSILQNQSLYYTNHI